MKKQKKMKPLCPKCRMGGYRQSVAYDGRPQFQCERCDNTWTSGRDGGEYAKLPGISRADKRLIKEV